MLHVHRDLVLARAREVDEIGERVDIESASNDHSDLDGHEKVKATVKVKDEGYAPYGLTKLPRMKKISHL